MMVNKTHKKQGFTLIEVMVTLIITVIGLGGLFLSEMAISNAQVGIRDMVYAVNLAELTINDLRLEGIEWTTNPGQGINQTRLKRLNTITGIDVKTGAGTAWQKAFLSSGTSRTVGPSGGDISGNYSGNTATYDDGIKNEFPVSRLRRYCVWYRLTWVVPNYAIRADVRVAWPKMSVLNTSSTYWKCPIAMVTDTNLINFVTLSSTINRYSSVK